VIKILPGLKKQRKAIMLEEKLEIIKRCEHNEHTVYIVRATGISESTLRTTRHQAEKIKVVKMQRDVDA
jgi:vancomycin permeability regulator SanA